MTEELGVESKEIGAPSEETDQLDAVGSPHGDIVFMMAACEDTTQRPELAAFAEVEPRNLSATSMTFYCNDAPTHESIALLMGKLEEDPICVTAVVTSCNEGFWERKRRYLVGCELTGRL